MSVRGGCGCVRERRGECERQGECEEGVSVRDRRDECERRV